MKEEPLKTLLDRDLQLVYIKEYFSDITDVMRDITNYGTNLLMRCFVTGKRELEDAIILGVLLRQAIEMFDALEILTSNSSIKPAHLQLRALFEVALYLQWILENDTSIKANYYYVSNVRNEKIWALRSQPGSPENLDFGQALDELRESFINTTNRIETEAKKYLVEINSILSQKEFKQIDMQIEKYKKDKNLKFEPAWYQPLGVRSVRQLSKKLNRLYEYEIFYSMTSNVMHSSKHQNHITFESSTIQFHSLRSLEGIRVVLTYSIAIILRIYRHVLRHYRYEELESFSKKYIEDWRTPFRNIKEVKYEKKSNDRDQNVTQS